MMRGTRRSQKVCEGEIDLGIQHRCFKVFCPYKKHRSQSVTIESSLLHLPCQRNDVERMELRLKKMNLEKIDYQYAPNNETILHMATRNQNREMICLLLKYGAQRSLRNNADQQAYQLAKTKDIQELFQRSEPFRFVCRNDTSESMDNLKPKIKCENYSLVSDHLFYEWELIDRNASQKALRFRHDVKRSIVMNEKVLKEKLYSIKKGYINLRLTDISVTDQHRIQNYFERALLKREPGYIITAYTTCQQFSYLINTDMARNVIHDLKNGCSKFSCDCLYSTDDGTKSITSILLLHPRFQALNFKGQVYRGIVVPKNALRHYKVDSCIITTTFLSTSKNSEVAQAFCGKDTFDPTKESFFCVYDIFNDDRTALDVSGISEYESEDEVLILPYTAFLITRIHAETGLTTIYLKEQCLKQMYANH